uniref:Uncharacterized protein n=1 Tax=Megaviridae environmental sample TaxID=1737588 RepID=A0A5J6VM02_9VIRU|nr:MAG: hypothetical protein [Megaviridae environmental sample]
MSTAHVCPIINTNAEQQAGPSTELSGHPGESRSPTTPSDNERYHQYSQQYDEYVILTHTKGITPFTSNGIQYLGRFNDNRPLIQELKRKVRRLITMEFNCTTCKERVPEYAMYFDQNGPIIFADVTAENDTSVRKCRSKIRAKVMEVYRQLNSQEWYIVPLEYPNVRRVEDSPHYNKLFSWPVESGTAENGRKFKHYTYRSVIPAPVQTMGTTKARHYAQAGFQYTPLIIGLLSRFRDLEGLQSSLRLMLRIVDASTYADKIKAALVWFEEIINVVLNQFQGRYIHNMNTQDIASVVGFAIFTAHPMKVDAHSVVLTWFDQINNNCLSLLQNARDEAGMKAMLEERFGSTKYQRPTEGPKESHVRDSMDVFSKMVNTVHAIGELERLDGTYVVNQPCADQASNTQVADAMAEMLSAAKQKKGKSNAAEGFAARSRTGRKVHHTPFVPKTFRDVIKGIEDGTITKLEVRGSSHPPMITTKTTLQEDWRSVPYFWGVYQGTTSDNFFGNYGYMEITHVHDLKLIKHHNIMLVPKNAHTRLLGNPTPWNTTFPVFLSASAHKYRQVFEGLVHKTRVSIPHRYECDNVACGVSVSLKNTAGTALLKPLDLKVNDVTVTITQY